VLSTILSPIYLAYCSLLASAVFESIAADINKRVHVFDKLSKSNCFM